jgi:hypothetical protein
LNVVGSTAALPACLAWPRSRISDLSMHRAVNNMILDDALDFAAVLLLVEVQCNVQNRRCCMHKARLCLSNSPSPFTIGAALSLAMALSLSLSLSLALSLARSLSLSLCLCLSLSLSFSLSLSLSFPVSHPLSHSLWLMPCTAP